MKASQALEIFLSMNVTAFKAGAKAAGNTVTNMGGTIKRSLKVSRTAFTVGQKSVMAYKNRLKELNTTAGGLNSTIGKLAALVGGGLVFGKAGQLAVGFNSTVEQSQIGLAALVRTFDQVPEGADRYARSMEVAGKIQRNLQIEGLKTVATYEQLLVALQEGIGPAFKQGFNPQQVVDFTSQMTQAAAALSLPMDQLGQEIRSILDATIDRNSRVAKALGITNEKVKEMAASGQLFEYLSDQLNEFKLAGEDAARTWTGAFSNLMDAVQMILGKGFDASFTATKQLFLDLRDAIVTIDEVAGTFTFNEKITAALSVADQAISSFIEGITKADMQRYLEILGQTVAAVVGTIGLFLDVMKSLFDVMGPALPLIAQGTTAFILFGGALKVLIGVPLMLGKQVLALNSAFVVLTGNSFLGWTSKAAGGFAKIRQGLSMTKISAMGLKGVLGSFAGIFLAWEIGTAVGKWASQFGWVKKSALGVIHTLDLGRLKAKQFWAMLSGGDTEAIQREIDAAKSAYSSLIADIDAGKDTGVSAHEKIAQAAAVSAQSQVDSQVDALNKMGEAYGEYADKVKKLMPGDEGYEGSEAYQSWKAIEGGGNTLDEPEEGMTKDELAAFYKSKEKPEESKKSSDATKKQLSADAAGLKDAKDKRLEETAAANDKLAASEKQLITDKITRDEERKHLLEMKDIENRDAAGSTATEKKRGTSSGGTIDPIWALNKQLEEAAAAQANPQPLQDPVITTPDPVIVDAPAVDASPALNQIFDEYVDRTKTALAKAPWSVSGSADEEKNRPAELASATPEISSLAAPLENMKQQARDAVAAVPASLAAMTSSSVHNLISKLQAGGSRSTSSGSRAGVAVNVPKKIIELRFPGGSLQGGEQDVNAFLSHLEKAGLTA